MVEIADTPHRVRIQLRAATRLHVPTPQRLARTPRRVPRAELVVTTAEVPAGPMAVVVEAAMRVVVEATEVADTINRNSSAQSPLREIEAGFFLVRSYPFRIGR